MSASCPPTGPVKWAAGDIVSVRMPPTSRNLEPGFASKVAFPLKMIWSNSSVPATGALRIRRLVAHVGGQTDEIDVAEDAPSPLPRLAVERERARQLGLRVGEIHVHGDVPRAVDGEVAVSGRGPEIQRRDTNLPLVGLGEGAGRRSQRAADGNGQRAHAREVFN